MRFPCFALIFVSCFFAPEFVQKLRQSRKRLFPVGHWNNIENRKNFFMSFAEKSGINPLNPAQWQRVTSAQIKAKEVTNPPPYQLLFLEGRGYKTNNQRKGRKNNPRAFQDFTQCAREDLSGVRGQAWYRFLLARGYSFSCSNSLSCQLSGRDAISPLFYLAGNWSEHLHANKKET